jgi:hypothetical protein
VDSLAEPRAVRRAVRLGLGLAVVLGLVRASAFLVYAWATLPTPLEAHFLEAKMVHLAWRVRAGLPLYPDWRGFPYVSNFYSPGYFLLVGGIGRAAGAGLDDLFFIGRGVTFASALLTTAALGWLVGRRHGRWAGLSASLVSLGATPMIGFAVMARPDLLAELLGLAGFVLSGRRPRRLCAAGCGLLVAAALTKQTAGVFLVARAIALCASGRKGRAAAVLVGGLGLLGAVVAAVSLLGEPNFLPSLLGEGGTPFDVATWGMIARGVASLCPDLVAFAIIGLAFWNRRRPRDVDAIVLTTLLLATCVATAGKKGAAFNYLLNLRIVEAMAVGALWDAARSAAPRARAPLAAAACLGALSLVPGTVNATARALSARRLAIARQGPVGRAEEAVRREAMRAAEAPGALLLTDSGLIDIHQKEATACGDPFLFRVLVETGQVVPVEMERRIEAEGYDAIVTTKDLNAPDYATFAFGLPMSLVERARRHYVLAGRRADLFFYARRGSGTDDRRPR